MKYNKEKFMSDFLKGTTCSIYYAGRCRIIFEKDNFIIVHHYAHSEYLNRFDLSTCCRVYFCLYDLSKEYRKYDIMYGEKYIHKIEGKRWSKKVLGEFLRKIKEVSE